MLILAILLALDAPAPSDADGLGAITPGNGSRGTGCPTGGCTFTGDVGFNFSSGAAGGLSHHAVGLTRYGTTTDVLNIVGTTYVTGNRTTNVTRTEGVTVVGNELHATGTLFVYGDGAGAMLQFYANPGPGNGTGQGDATSSTTVIGGFDGLADVFVPDGSATTPAIGRFAGANSVTPGALPIVQATNDNDGLFFTHNHIHLTIGSIEEYDFGSAALLPGPARDNALDLGSAGVNWKDIHSKGALTAGTIVTTSTIQSGGNITATGDVTCGTAGSCNLNTPSNTALTVESHGAGKDITLAAGSAQIDVQDGSLVTEGTINAFAGVGLGIFGGTTQASGALYVTKGASGVWEAQSACTTASCIAAYIMASGGSTYTQLLGGTGLIVAKDDGVSCAANAATVDPKGQVVKLTTSGSSCTVTMAKTNVSTLLANAGASLGTNAMSSLTVSIVVVDDPGVGHTVTFPSSAGTHIGSGCTLAHKGGTYSLHYIGSIGEWVPSGCTDGDGTLDVPTGPLGAAWRWTLDSVAALDSPKGYAIAALIVALFALFIVVKVTREAIRR